MGGLDKGRSYLISNIPLHAEALDPHECFRNHVAGGSPDVLFDPSTGVGKTSLSRLRL